ncbi:hypothetical protein [Streptomyces sp. NPDC000983]|uniref:hypothetical protein n=1 Tax=Streptomyces sp. NPDC000983 TaxID=3154373 RepID=UPI00331C91D5
MADSTQAPVPVRNPAAYGWCAWHENYARGVRLIHVIEQGSGPGTAGKRFACRPCRHAYDLVPLADRP